MNVRFNCANPFVNLYLARSFEVSIEHKHTLQVQQSSQTLLYHLLQVCFQIYVISI
eukprot:c41389_g1_i1 orf=305-472(+)